MILSKILPPGIKSSIKQLIYFLNEKYNYEYKNYDRDTSKVIRGLKKNSVCIDIGCNKGEILKIIIENHPDSKHFAFEPLPDYVKILKNRFSKHAYIYDVALSDKQDEVDFNFVVSNPEYSGLIKRQYPTKSEEIKLIKVKTELLDNIVPKSTKIDFIKIDVEGAEYFVLKGGINLIKRDKPIIIFEFGLGAADFYKVNADMIYDLLSDAGLKISLMEYYLNKQAPLDKYDFNKQFINGYNYYFIAYP